MSNHEITCPTPFAKSWWVDPPRLLAGCYPGDMDRAVAERKLAALLRVGIREIINLQQENETGGSGKPFVGYDAMLDKLAADSGIIVRRTRFPIRDMGVPDVQTMVSILNAIDAALQQARPVYVHCWGGHGRTGTVVGCWLVRHGLNGNEVLSRIAILRRHGTGCTPD